MHAIPCSGVDKELVFDADWHRKWLEQNVKEIFCQFCGNMLLFGYRALLCKENPIPSLLNIEEMVRIDYFLDFSS